MSSPIPSPPSPSISSPFLRLNISDPWDLLIFVGVAVNLLIICYFLGFDGLKINFKKTGLEYNKSSNQRIVFYFSLLIASIYKFGCMSLEALFFSNSSCVDNHLCTFVRFSPDVVFIVANGILLSHWAQLAYDFTGVHSVIPHRIYLISIGTLVCGFFPIMFIHPKDQPDTHLYIFLGVSHLLFFLLTIGVGVFLIGRIPSGINIGKKVNNRVVAIIIIFSYSSLLSAMLFLLVMQTLWLVGYPKHRLLLFDGIVFLFKDIIPIYLILYFTSKKRIPPSNHPNRTNFTSSTLMNILPTNRQPYTRIPDLPAVNILRR